MSLQNLLPSEINSITLNEQGNDQFKSIRPLWNKLKYNQDLNLLYGRFTPKEAMSLVNHGVTLNDPREKERIKNRLDSNASFNYYFRADSIGVKRLFFKIKRISGLQFDRKDY
jgi:hypothetical protein